MAEDKRISKRGVRAMMRPKPRRVQRRDPFAPMRVHSTLFYVDQDGLPHQIEEA